MSRGPSADVLRAREKLLVPTHFFLDFSPKNDTMVALGDVRAGTLRLDQFSGMGSASSAWLWSTAVLVDGPARGVERA